MQQVHTTNIPNAYDSSGKSNQRDVQSMMNFENESWDILIGRRCGRSTTVYKTYTATKSLRYKEKGLNGYTKQTKVHSSNWELMMTMEGRIAPIY